jgi:hypothetical protein
MRLKPQHHGYMVAAAGTALAILVLAPPLYLQSWSLVGYELGTVGFALGLMWMAAAAFLAALERFSLSDD